MNENAPDGQVWVCGACGKRSKDLYGYKRISLGWDESYTLHAILCYEDKLKFHANGTMVVEVLEGGVVKDGSAREESS